MFVFSLINLYRLRRQQWLKTEKLEEIQRKKLRRMIKHAYENVLYYRRLFESVGVRPEDIKTVEDLQKIPITTKEQLQKLEPKEIIAKGVNPNRCRKLTTSGSTGIPLLIFLRNKDFEFYNLVWARTSMECGQRLFDRFVYLKAIPPPRPRFWFEHLGVWKRHIVSYRYKLDKQIELLRHIRPRVIKSYSLKLFELARYIKKKGVKDVRLRSVLTMGCTLDHKSREMIESAFRTEVFDCYGSFELGCIAWECSEHKGYHINCDSLVLELIKDGRAASPGEIGKIVCTSLHSFAMPFIRYEIGDVGIGSDKKCPCGRGLPLLKSIEGRTDDLFVSPSGELYTTPGFIVYFKSISGISQFRIIQESLECITVQIKPDKNFSEEIAKQIKETLQKLTGGNLNIKVEVVDTIPPDPSGKLRSIISNVHKEL